MSSREMKSECWIVSGATSSEPRCQSSPNCSETSNLQWRDSGDKGGARGPRDFELRQKDATTHNVRACYTFSRLSAKLDLMGMDKNSSFNHSIGLINKLHVLSLYWKVHRCDYFDAIICLLFFYYIAESFRGNNSDFGGGQKETNRNVNLASDKSEWCR